MKVPSAKDLRSQPEPQEDGGQQGWGMPPGEDSVAYVTKGELVVPQEILQMHPEIVQLVRQAMHTLGGDDSSLAARFVDHPEGVYDEDGMQQFGIFKSIKKAAKKVFANPIARTVATVGASLIPGVGAYAAPLVAAGTTKLGGGSWAEAAGAGVGQLASGWIGGKLDSQLGGLGTVDGLFGSDFGGSFGNLALSNVLGSMVAQNLGSGLAGAFFPEKQQMPDYGFDVPQSSPLPNSNTPGNPWWATTPQAGQTYLPTAGAWDVPGLGVSYTRRPYDSQSEADNAVPGFSNNIYGSGRRGGFGNSVYV